eukprot:6009546-Pleurochrysis_carterae.AAC.2
MIERSKVLQLLHFYARALGPIGCSEATTMFVSQQLSVIASPRLSRPFLSSPRCPRLPHSLGFSRSPGFSRFRRVLTYPSMLASPFSLSFRSPSSYCIPP